MPGQATGPGALILWRFPRRVLPCVRRGVHVLHRERRFCTGPTDTLCSLRLFLTRARRSPYMVHEEITMFDQAGEMTP